MWTNRQRLHFNPRQRRGLDAYAILLFVQLWQQIQSLEYKPPVTLGLIFGGYLAILSFRLHKLLLNLVITLVEQLLDK
jgi:hypothetical protein